MSLLGSIAGGLFSMFSSNQQAKQDQENYATRIQTTVADAKAAGINPLEAIRAGAGNSSAAATPRLMSAEASMNAFDQVADVLAGRTAQENAKDAVENTLAQIRVDESRRGSIGAGSGVATGTAAPAAPRLQSSSAPRATTPTGYMGSTPDQPAATAYPSVFDDNGAPIVDERLGVLSDQGSISETGRRGSNLYPHPAARDIGALEERHGETPELYSMIQYPYSMMRDAQYSHRLGSWATEQDINPRDAHEQMMDDPSRLSELPSFGQSLWSDMRRETAREWDQIQSWLPTTEPATETYTYPRLGGMMGSSF
jgi:hypothetical protein